MTYFSSLCLLQHGAAVFLYHPCADEVEIKKLKDLARSCLRKHIITPYRPLGTEKVTFFSKAKLLNGGC